MPIEVILSYYQNQSSLVLHWSIRLSPICMWLYQDHSIRIEITGLTDLQFFWGGPVLKMTHNQISSLIEIW